MKITYQVEGCLPIDVLLRNMALTKALNLKSWERGSSRLAVIGGANSILDRVEELRDFDGDKLIVAGAYRWCLENGISGTFFSVDPQAFIADLADQETVKQALLASCSDPSVFECFRDSDVRVFDIRWNEEMNHCGTTATAAFWLALEGYKETTFFGCDSSYGKQSHAYENAPHKFLMDVVVGGEHFTTDPLMLMQGEFMAEILRRYPVTFKNRSEGLLKALIEHGDYDVVGGNDATLAWLGMKKAA